MRKEKPAPQSVTNLEFMISAMQAVGKKHVIARHFGAQFELEIGTQGVDRLDMVNTLHKLHNTASSMADRENFCVFPRHTFKSRAPQNDSSQSSINISQTPIASTTMSPQTTQQIRVEAMSQGGPMAPVPFASSNFPPQPQQPDSGSETIDTDFSWPPTENTPSSNSSGSNTAYPYRNANRSLPVDSSDDNWILYPVATRFNMDPLTLNVTNMDRDNNLQDNEALNGLLNGAPVSLFCCLHRPMICRSILDAAG